MPQRDGVRTSNQQPATDNRSGFTLIELLVVITLIMVLAGMAMVQYRTSVQRAKEAVLQTDLLRMRDAIDQYYADKGRYPASLDTLVSERYLRDVPVDPMTNRKDTWVTEPAPPDPSNQSGGPGIYDIRSGSDGTAINGTRYSTW
ncbi:MAG TPA: type II secretion system protein [Vicinamibacterales bacterium]